MAAAASSGMLKLERSDLLQIEPISYTGTLKLFPLGKKNKQKLVIGDDLGQISCYEFKKGEPQIVFQTAVFDGPVTCVALGGNASKRDKIFLSHSQRIVGLSKKGKEFFKMTSSLTETIQNIAVEDTRIWTCCENVYNLYDNGEDTAFYISKDNINQLLVARLTRPGDWDTVLACQDCCIRLIHASKLFIEIPTSDPVTALASISLESYDISPSTTIALVYGLSTGGLGMVQLLGNGTFHRTWFVEDDESRRTAITCLCVYDIDSDGRKEVVVGRDDGRVEVFKLAADAVTSAPSIVFCRDIGETVRSIECGVVCTPDYPEVIVASYSGKVISFTTEPILARAADDNYGRSVQTINNENRLKHMNQELTDLKKRLDKERDKLKKSAVGETAARATQSAAADFPINSKFYLDTKIAAYILTIELQIPIDLIILRSPVVLDLLESDAGSSVLSITPPYLQQLSSPNSEDTQGKFVAVFRCQSKERRISLTLRTNEGEHGSLYVTIVAESTPKAAKIVKYDLKPLSLHTKLHELSPAELARPRNKMRYSGAIQLPPLHEWIQAIFPDVPPRLDEGTTEQRYFFRNTFSGAVAVVEFRKHEMLFECENASTIAIIKENITRFANYRRISLEEFVTPSEATIGSFLSLIRPKLDVQINLTRKMQVVDAIQEIAMMDAAEGGSNQWLCKEYSDIYNEQEALRREHQQRDKSLEYLSGLITDLFIDWNRLNGFDARPKVASLQHTVMTGDFENILNEFLELSHKR